MLVMAGTTFSEACGTLSTTTLIKLVTAEAADYAACIDSAFQRVNIVLYAKSGPQLIYLL
jgi:hypothetical protein